MKKKSLLKSFLICTLASLSFTACGKKKATTKDTTTTVAPAPAPEPTPDVDPVVNSKKCYVTEDGAFVKIDVEENVLTNVIISSGVGYCLYLKPIIENNKYVALQAINASNDEPGQTPSYQLIKTGNEAIEITKFNYSRLNATNDAVNFTYSYVNCPLSLCAKLSDDKITIYVGDKTYELNMDGSMNVDLAELTSTSIIVNDIKASYENETLKTFYGSYGNFEISLKKDEFKLQNSNGSSEMKVLDDKITITETYPDSNNQPFVFEEITFKLDNDKYLSEYSYYDGYSEMANVTSYAYSDDKKTVTLTASTKDKDGNVYNIPTSKVIEYDDFGRVSSTKEYVNTGTETIQPGSKEYTYDSYGKTLSLTIGNNKDIYEYDTNNLIKKQTYQVKSGDNFVTTKYNTYEYTNGDLTKAEFFDVDGENEVLTRKVYETFENGKLKEYVNLEYSSNNLTDKSFKKVYTYNSNNKLANYQVLVPNSEGTDFYKKLEHNYTYTTEGDYSVVEDEKLWYTSAGEIDYRGLEKTKNKADTNIWQELHYNGTGYTLAIEDTTIFKEDGTADRTKIYFNDDETKNYGETKTYNIGDLPRSVLDDRNAYEKLQRYGIFFSFDGENKITTGESFYNENGWTYKDIDYSYNGDKTLKEKKVTEVEPSDSFYNSNKIKETTETYNYATKTKVVNIVEYFVTEGKIKSTESSAYNLDTDEIIGSSITTYVIENNDYHIYSTTVLSIDKESNKEITKESIYKYFEFEYSENSYEPYMITTTTLDKTNNTTTTIRYSNHYDSKHPNIISVTEYRFNSEINEWQAFKDYISMDDTDDVLGEYFYENNKLVKKESIFTSGSDTEKIIESYDDEEKLIKREDIYEEEYDDNIYRVYYSIDTKLKATMDYNDLELIEEYYVINGTKLVYYQKTLDTNNKKLYAVAADYDYEDDEFVFVDVVIYDENSYIESVTRYVNDYADSTKLKHSVYTLKSEICSSYNEYNYHYNFSLSSDFDAVEGSQNLDNIITFDNAPTPKN